jgi:hypothetical protein
MRTKDCWAAEEFSRSFFGDFSRRKRQIFRKRQIGFLKSRPAQAL